MTILKQNGKKIRYTDECNRSFFPHVHTGRPPARRTDHPAEKALAPYLLHTYVIIFMRSVYRLIPALDRWYIVVPLALIMGAALMGLLGLPILNDLYNDLIRLIKKLLYREPESA